MASALPRYQCGPLVASLNRDVFGNFRTCPRPRRGRSAVHRRHPTPPPRRPSDAVSPPVPGPPETLYQRPRTLAARGHLPRCPARRGRDRRPQRLVCAGQPQQRQSPGCLQHGDRRRRPHHPVDQERPEPAAVAVRRFRGRLLPHQVPPLGQGAVRPQLVHRERRLDRPVGRPERHQPAVAAGRQLGRLREADLAPQQQGPRSTRRLHRRQREHRPVRRLGRHQPAVAARQGRRRHPRLVRSSVDLPLDLDGRAGAAQAGVGLAQGLHRRPLQRQTTRLRDHARHGSEGGVR
ncbi:hypothetical protein SHIRM173S_12780 [Streptomyces hirsutus]